MLVIEYGGLEALTCLTCTRLRQVCLYFGLIVVSVDLSYCTRTYWVQVHILLQILQTAKTHPGNCYTGRPGIPTVQYFCDRVEIYHCTSTGTVRGPGIHVFIL